MADERRCAVLVDDGPVRQQVAVALRRGFGAEEPDEAEEPEGAIAVPAPDDEGEAGAPPRVPLDRAEVAVVLDAASLARARRAEIPKVVALWPDLDARWDGPLDVDLALVAHEALVADAVEAGAPRRAVVVVGPVAPDGWAPAEDRGALRGVREIDPERPTVVVRAAALARDDLAPALVQLSLVRRDAQWLLDVGADPDLARALRRHVPGYGLDARMFADGPEARPSYQLADLVLGRLEGPEALRALSVGAGLVTVPPTRSQLRLAHVVESAGLARIADAAPTLAVTLDAALAPSAVEAAREASAGLDAVNGVARVVAEVRSLLRGERGAAVAAGLPEGLERLSLPDDDAPRRRPHDDAPRGPREDLAAEDLDAEVDAELAALRERLGL